MIKMRFFTIAFSIVTAALFLTSCGEDIKRDSSSKAKNSSSDSVSVSASEKDSSTVGTKAVDKSSKGDNSDKSSNNDTTDQTTADGEKIVMSGKSVNIVDQIDLDDLDVSVVIPDDVLSRSEKQDDKKSSNASKDGDSSVPKNMEDGWGELMS